MLRFIRLFGGALGVILAIALVGFDGSSAMLLEPSIAGRLLLLAWIAVGRPGCLAPYFTIVPVRWLVRAVRTCHRQFVAAIAGLCSASDGPPDGHPLTSCPTSASAPIGAPSSWRWA
jgi:hypothetical protein